MLDISTLITGFYSSFSSKISQFLTVYLPKLFMLFVALIKRTVAWFVANYLKMQARLKIRK